MPSSERQEGLCCFYSVVQGSFFALLVPTERPSSSLCTEFALVVLAAGCYRETESLPYLSSTHGPNKKLEERRLNGS